MTKLETYRPLNLERLVGSCSPVSISQFRRSSATICNRRSGRTGPTLLCVLRVGFRSQTMSSCQERTEELIVLDSNTSQKKLKVHLNDSGQSYRIRANCRTSGMSSEGYCHLSGNSSSLQRCAVREQISNTGPQEGRCERLNSIRRVSNMWWNTDYCLFLTCSKPSGHSTWI